MKIVITSIEDATPSAFQLYWDIKEVLWGMVEVVRIRGDSRDMMNDRHKDGDPTPTADSARNHSMENDTEYDTEPANGENDVDKDAFDSETEENEDELSELPAAFGTSRRIYDCDTLPSTNASTKKRKRKTLRERKDSKKRRMRNQIQLPLQCELPRSADGKPPQFENVFMILGADGLYYPGVCLGKGPSNWADISGTGNDDNMWKNRYTGAGSCVVQYLGAGSIGKFTVFRHPDYLRPVSEESLAYVHELVNNEPYDLPIPEEFVGLEKYWDQRFRLCSKFDKGIQLDRESWYSITPESIGRHVAKRCTEALNHADTSSNSHTATIVECFSGCGGTLITLAAEAKSISMNLTVIGVEMDPEKARMCLNNCKVYEVGKEVDVVCGDVYDFLGGSGLPMSRRPIEPAEELTRDADTEAEPSTDAIKPSTHIRFSDDDDNAANIDDTTGCGMSVCVSALVEAPAGEVPSSSNSQGADLDSSCSPVEDRSVSKKTPHYTNNSACRDGLVDIIVMSPPWGGPQYKDENVFLMRSMLSCGDGNGIELIKLSLSVCPNLVLILPRNISKREFGHIKSLVQLPCVIEEVYMHGKHKLSIVYIGHLFAKLK
jgi:predicted RNA methylase